MSLANEYKGSAVFGEVRFDKTLKDKFGVEQMPTIYYLEDAENYKGVKYEGKLDFDLMVIWVQNFLINSSGDFANTNDSVKELSFDMIQKGSCSKYDSGFCLILFFDHQNFDLIKNFYQILSQRFIERPIQIFMMDTNLVCKYCVLGQNSHDSDMFLLMGKSSKFANIGKLDRIDVELAGKMIDIYLKGEILLNYKMDNEAYIFFINNL